MDCTVYTKKVDLKEKLINNTRALMKQDTRSFYPILVDYNRQLFNELYDLDIFCFIENTIVDKFCKKHNRCKEFLL